MTKFASCTPSSLSHETFVAKFGGVFEHAPWIATQAFAAGINPSHDQVDSLHALFAEIVADASADLKDQLIDNHPALAAPLPLGEAHDNSRGEQARAGLDSLDNEQRKQFRRLNDVYREKFGFVFILAVDGMDAASIIANFNQRLVNGTHKGERAEALTQIVKIAYLRMTKL